MDCFLVYLTTAFPLQKLYNVKWYTLKFVDELLLGIFIDNISTAEVICQVRWEYDHEWWLHNDLKRESRPTLSYQDTNILSLMALIKQFIGDNEWRKHWHNIPITPLHWFPPWLNEISDTWSHPAIYDTITQCNQMDSWKEIVGWEDGCYTISLWRQFKH